MRLKSGVHLAYCGNVHRGETWEEMFSALRNEMLQVRDRAAFGKPFGIGLRLSDAASRALTNPGTLEEFRRWLEANECYVFTINGFPFGRFHGGKVKEQVFAPDWSTPERLEYTKRLFDILAALLPKGVEGSVSTLPGSFKAFRVTDAQLREIRNNLWLCVDHIAAIAAATGHDLHLGLEPEPFGLCENTDETLRFFESMAAERADDERLTQHLGINYDTCHFAVQYEDPSQALSAFQANGIRISKIHLSSALRAIPNEAARAVLRLFADDVYLHQVVARSSTGALARYQDLPIALAAADAADEWRIHFHVPLYAEPEGGLRTTRDHLLSTLDWLAKNRETCTHLEMETYTWEVLPVRFKCATVVDQLSREYEWILLQLKARGLA